MSYSFISSSPAPYFLLIAGLFAGISCGSAFSATLKESVKEWSITRTRESLAAIRGIRLLIPFLGICGGVCVFLASGIQIFAFSAKISYAIALPLTVLTGGLVWYQLGQILRQLQQGGSKALDLDSLF
ncbi:MAG: hypothetical protein ACFE0I_12370 [Elainellaceae cyanobacterium]